MQIEIDNIKLQEIEEDLCNVGAYSYDCIAVDSSNISNQTEDTALRLLEEKETIQKRIKRNTLFCLKIEKAMDILSNTERFIIEQVYFKNFKDYEIYLNVDYGLSRGDYYRKKRDAKNKIKIALM